MMTSFSVAGIFECPNRFDRRQFIRDDNCFNANDYAVTTARRSVKGGVNEVLHGNDSKQSILETVFATWDIRVIPYWFADISSGGLISLLFHP
jgi:hypothetical protein